MTSTAITVDIGSFHHHHPPVTPQHLPNHTPQRGDKPLPSHEGCGLNHRHPGMRRTDGSHTRPSPFQRDVGRFIVDGGLGKLAKELGMEKRGGTQELGGPSSASPNNLRTTTESCGSLLFLSHLPSTDHP